MTRSAADSHISAWAGRPDVHRHDPKLAPAHAGYFDMQALPEYSARYPENEINGECAEHEQYQSQAWPPPGLAS